MRGDRRKRSTGGVAAFRVLVALFILSTLDVSGCSRSLRIVEPTKRVVDKRAILVLPGLNMRSKGYRAAKKWYPGHYLDVFIPEYISDEGLDGCVANLERFVDDNRLTDYREVHAFAYLMGAWTLNRYLERHPSPNLKKIVYGRSPFQEQAPRIVLQNIPRLIHLFFGRAVDELRDTPYPPLEHNGRQIGIIVENRASPYIRRHRDELRPLYSESWTPRAFRQPHDDLIYVYLNHNEMYHRFDVLGPELLSFFETGRFTPNASRRPIDQDPFKR